MNEMEKREIEILAGLCYDDEVPLKLAKDLLKAAKINSYENMTESSRIKEYQNLITFHSQN